MLLASADPLVLRGLERVAATAGLSMASAEDDPRPEIVVIDLDRPDALQEIGFWRRRCPDAFIAGHASVPRRDLWLEAQAAGCDLVANRGAFATQLVRKLPPPGQPRYQRLRLVEAADVPGRIGVVLRMADSPVGPVALYHVRGELCALQDVCPHAGATLSTGELEGSVITCPGHGSRFDIRTGERLRGPADEGLRTFTVVQEEGGVYLRF